jgi:hypothetical protein
MAKDPLYISHHNLPYHDEDALMKELSMRFNVNVDFIFHKEFLSLLDEYELNTAYAEHTCYGDNYHTYKRFIKEEGLPTLFISEIDFEIRLLYKKHGMDFLNFPEVKKSWRRHSKEALDYYQSIIDSSQNYCLSYANFDIHIYPYCCDIAVDTQFYLRWNDYIRMFNDLEYVLFEEFLEHRNEVIKLSKIIGGEKGFIIHTESPHNIDETVLSFSEYFNLMHQNLSGENLLDLEKIIKDEDYHKANQKNDYHYFENIQFYDNYNPIELKDSFAMNKNEQPKN